MTAPTRASELAPALEVYGAEIARHSRDYSVFPIARCECGWQSTAAPRQASRSLGLHIGAAHRRASRAFDAAVDAIRIGGTR